MREPRERKKKTKAKVQELKRTKNKKKG